MNSSDPKELRAQMRAEAKAKLIEGMTAAMHQVLELPPPQQDAAMRTEMREVARTLLDEIDRNSSDYLPRVEALVDAIVELGSDTVTLNKLLSAVERGTA